MRDQLSWLSHKMNESLNNLANQVEQLQHRTASEHAQLTSTLTTAVEQSREGAWEYSDKMKSIVEGRIADLDKVSPHPHVHMILS